MVVVVIDGKQEHFAWLARFIHWDYPDITHYKVIKKYVKDKFVLGDIELNAPYMEAPELGIDFWHAQNGFAIPGTWHGGLFENNLLQNFNCWKTKEDALNYIHALKELVSNAWSTIK
jgi:hypothetical protein